VTDTPPTDPFLPILRALAAHQVSAVVVGGLATVLYGHARLTHDVDVAIDMAPENVTRLLAACAAIGLEPAVPEAPTTFGDPVRRASWTADRNVVDFPWTQPRGLLHLEILLDPPVPFAELHRAAVQMPVLGVPIAVASLTHLIALKEAAGRPQDEVDVRHLRALDALRVRRASEPPAATERTHAECLAVSERPLPPVAPGHELCPSEASLLAQTARLSPEERFAVLVSLWSFWQAEGGAARRRVAATTRANAAPVILAEGRVDAPDDSGSVAARDRPR